MRKPLSQRIDWPLVTVMTVVLVVVVCFGVYLHHRRGVADHRQAVINSELQRQLAEQRKLDELYQGTHDAVCVIIDGFGEPKVEAFRVAWDLAKSKARCAPR